MKKYCFILILGLAALFCRADDGYRLWLRYERIDDAKLLREYRSVLATVKIVGNSPTLSAARNELAKAFEGFLNQKPDESHSTGNLLLAAKGSAAEVRALLPDYDFTKLGK